MIAKPAGAIGAADILAFIDNQVAENRSLEYKESLPGNSDDDKREFLADISSFANAGGGDIIYGLVESEGVPVRIKGIAKDLDAEILRLENIIRDGLDPRIPVIKFVPLRDFPEGSILLIRIPESWIAPHMVKFKNHSRFYTRSSNGKHQMDITEIRSAFLRSGTISEQIRRFRDVRLGKIIASETPTQLDSGWKLVVHVLPFVSFSTRFELTVEEIEKRLNYLYPVNMGSGGRRINLDGVMTYSDSKRAYNQAFRNGCIEAVSVSDYFDKGNGAKAIYRDFDEEVVSLMSNFLQFLESVNVTCPIYCFLSLIGVKDTYLNVDPYFPLQRFSTSCEHENLILPEVEIRAFPLVSGGKRSGFEENAKMLRPALDTVWNAYGYPTCLNFDEEGKWKRR